MDALTICLSLGLASLRSLDLALNLFGLAIIYFPRVHVYVGRTSWFEVKQIL